MDPIDAFHEYLSTTVVPVTMRDKPDALEYAARQGQVSWHHLPRAHRQKAYSEEDSTWRFPENEKFNQTPYKLPPPTPIHVPAEKRHLEEKSLPFSKKRSKVRITPVMRRVSRLSELPMAPVQIPQPPVQIPHVLEPVKIPQPPVQIPVSQVPEPPVQIPVSQVLEPPVQIILVHIQMFHNMCRFSVTSLTATYVDSPRTYEHSTCIRTCADSRCSRICADYSVTSPTATMQILHVSEPLQIPVSQVPQLPVQIPPVQSLPAPMQLLPELDTLDPLESSDAFDQLMTFVFEPQELQLLHTVPSIFDGVLFSFLDEFEGSLWT
ncbi:hypothetical protein TNCV_3525851 [Trichonephila clavipes]|nr:hypothetical protein TNCV_3525851 [Trichonephila clavipes]